MSDRGQEKGLLDGKTGLLGRAGRYVRLFSTVGTFLIFTDKRRKNILLIDNITKITYNEGESAKN